MTVSGATLWIRIHRNKLAMFYEDGSIIVVLPVFVKISKSLESKRRKQYGMDWQSLGNIPIWCVCPVCCNLRLFLPRHLPSKFHLQGSSILTFNSSHITVAALQIGNRLIPCCRLMISLEPRESMVFRWSYTRRCWSDTTRTHALRIGSMVWGTYADSQQSDRAPCPLTTGSHKPSFLPFRWFHVPLLLAPGDPLDPGLSELGCLPPREFFDPEL